MKGSMNELVLGPAKRFVAIITILLSGYSTRNEQGCWLVIN